MLWHPPKLSDCNEVLLAGNAAKDLSVKPRHARITNRVALFKFDKIGINPTSVVFRPTKNVVRNVADSLEDCPGLAF